MGKTLTIQSMRQLAERRGGSCLSPVYVNASTKLTWQCAKGHHWMATPQNIQRGKWCPYCAGRGKTIRDMQQLAALNGGQCLSDAYVSSRSKLLWQCAKGHQWNAPPARIGGGHWCPDCAGRIPLTIQEMRSLAESRGGKCLSDAYVNSQTPIMWQCGAGHRWRAAPSGVKSGTWCRVCAGLSKPSMDDIQRLAQERGGKCLSQNYRNARTHLEWECKEGHRWAAAWGQIQEGHWCPECSAGLGERICREFFNQLFQNSFPKSRPDWLVNKAGNQTELDGYCATLGIAFEHQGEQHYSTKGYFINSDLDLARRQENDALKSELCAQRGITLVAVPQIPDRLPLDQVRTFIKRQLAANGIPLAHDFDTRDVDINKAYRTGGSREILNYLQGIALDRGGKCLSKQCANNQTKLLWECSKGHRWEADPAHIKQGEWCPKCGGTLRKTLEEMQEIAAARGGKCLSAAYEDNHTGLLWECSKGHKWETTPSVIMRGFWCPECSGNAKLTIEQMHRLAETRGGRCLSDEYISANRRLLWQCKDGHQWEATPHSIKRGRWCPVCAGKGKTVEDMKNLAAQHGGQCLSEVYKNNKAILLWQCHAGHTWEATPDHVQRGRWCPFCAGQVKKTIEDMKNLAADRGGQCLSPVYKNVNTKLLWQCQAGHKWETTPDHILRGSWCPECWTSRRGHSRRLGLPEMQSIAASRRGRCLSVEYVNTKVHLLWQCKDGHQWEATPDTIKSGRWCPVCGNRRKGRRKAT